MLFRDAVGSGKHFGFLNSPDLNKYPFVVVFADTLMRFFCEFCRGLAALGLVCAAWPSALAAAAPEGIEFFENHIRPVLVKNCYKCHSQKAGKAKGELQLDTQAGLLKGGEVGPAIVPGNPKASLLIQAVSYDNGDLQMPPKTKLPQASIDKLIQWVAMGAPDPRDGKTADITDKDAFDIAERKAEHWAWQPVRRDIQPPSVETVGGADWASTAVDRFILAKLQAAELSPSVRATRRTLVRRLYFDLIGLPPTPGGNRGVCCRWIAERLRKPCRTICSPRRTSASAGGSTGSTWCAFAETRGHESGLSRSRRRIATATTSSVP